MDSTSSVNHTVRSQLTISGKPMSTPVRGIDPRIVVERMARGAISRNAEETDGLVALTAVCLEMIVGMLDGDDGSRAGQRITPVAARSCRCGLSIGAALHAIHRACSTAIEFVADNATAKDLPDLVEGTRRTVELLDTVTATLSAAYVRELTAAVDHSRSAAHALTVALLRGGRTAAAARVCGIAIAAEYSVVALAFPDVHRSFRRLRSELTFRCGETTLSLLGAEGGTVLIPAGSLSAAAMDELPAQLGEAAQAAITAVACTAAAAEIPIAADKAHELLDIVRRLRYPPGLYRFGDLMLEYQLTRPGPGREALDALLNPLDDYPELQETLRCHLGTGLQRRRTAELLDVHVNTIDYRLRRIGQLTGVDAMTTAGLYQLRSAMIARIGTRRDVEGTERRGVAAT